MKPCRVVRWLAGLPLLSLMAPGAAGCQGVDIEECEVTRAVDRFVLALPAEPADAFKVERCRVDVDACPALCLRDFEVSDGGFLVEAEECNVKFFADHVTVTFRYRDSSCPFPGGEAEEGQAR